MYDYVVFCNYAFWCVCVSWFLHETKKKKKCREWDSGSRDYWSWLFCNGKITWKMDQSRTVWEEVIKIYCFKRKRGNTELNTAWITRSVVHLIVMWMSYLTVDPRSKDMICETRNSGPPSFSLSV